MTKRIKILTALLLAFLFLFSLSATAFAQEDIEQHKESFKQCLIERYGYTKEQVDALNDQLAFTYYGQSNGYAICFAATAPSIMISHARIGNYRFYNDSYFTPDGLGLFAIKGEQVLPLGEAYMDGSINMEEIVPLFPAKKGADKWFGFQTFRLGDIDFDGITTVKDVLSVQKHIAQIMDLSTENSDYVVFGIDLADVNMDGHITVADVLLAQRIIAGEQLPGMWQWKPIG